MSKPSCCICDSQLPAGTADHFCATCGHEGLIELVKAALGNKPDSLSPKCTITVYASLAAQIARSTGDSRRAADVQAAAVNLIRDTPPLAGIHSAYYSCASVNADQIRADFGVPPPNVQCDKPIERILENIRKTRQVVPAAEPFVFTPPADPPKYAEIVGARLPTANVAAAPFKVPTLTASQKRSASDAPTPDPKRGATLASNTAALVAIRNHVSSVTQPSPTNPHADTIMGFKTPHDVLPTGWKSTVTSSSSGGTLVRYTVPDGSMHQRLF